MLTTHRRLVTAGMTACALLAPPSRASALQAEERSDSVVSYVPVARGALYSHVVGHGIPVIVPHGGPDLDHAYLLPDLDRLSDAFRLIYYDQRGRGRSANDVRPEDVTLGSEMDGLDSVRAHLGLDAPVLLGHSWGAELALEHAIRHPSRVSHPILMNPAPASASDLAVMREFYLEQLGPAAERQQAIVASQA